MIKWILFCLIITTSLGCENFCNFKGVCGPKDVCNCFMGWGGICPYGEAFADIPLGDLKHNKDTNNQANREKYSTEWTAYGIDPYLKGYVTDNRIHRYAECSNAGLCDRKTGECRCFTGYEGSACERRGCPPYKTTSSSTSTAPCGGHGKCISNYEKYLDYNQISDPVAHHGWELEKFYTCVCDEGFSGYDCSLRTCPVGYKNIDSDTVLSYDADKDTPTAGKLDEILQAEFYFEVEYNNGNKYKTQSIDYGNCNAPTNPPNIDTVISENINVALNVIPGLSIDSVVVTCGTGGTPTANYKSIEISLKNQDPNIKSLTVNYESGTPTPTTTTLELNFTAKKNGVIIDRLETAECSDKGICNTETGECECFIGYIGAACDRDLQQIQL